MKKQKETKDGWWCFLELCSHVKTPQDFREFFNLFLTLEEKEDLAKRYLLVKALLEEKLTQREIAEKIGVSISKITRGSNVLKTINSNLREFLKKHMK